MYIAYIIIPLLAGGIPNLGFDDLIIIDMDAASCEFDTDRGFRFEAKLIARESRKEVRFSDTGVSYQHHLEEVIVVVVGSVRRHYEILRLEKLSLERYWIGEEEEEETHKKQIQIFRGKTQMNENRGDPGPIRLWIQFRVPIGSGP